MKHFRVLNKALFCVIFLLFTRASIAQNLVKRYSSELPESVVQNLFEVDRVEKKLNDFALIHPRMIYWYLEFLNHRLTSDQFLQIKNYYLKQKISWITQASKYIRAHAPIDSTALISWLQLKELPKNVWPVDSLPDVNSTPDRSDYIIVKYFAPTWKLSYDSTFDYVPVLRYAT